MEITIEKEKFLPDNKVVLSVSRNGSQWTCFPSMTEIELTEIRDEINEFLSKSDKKLTEIPKNIPCDNTSEVETIISHILKLLENRVSASILFSEYKADSALIAANKFKDAGYFVYVSRNHVNYAIFAYQIYKRDLYPNAEKL